MLILCLSSRCFHNFLTKKKLAIRMRNLNVPGGGLVLDESGLQSAAFFWGDSLQTSLSPKRTQDKHKLLHRLKEGPVINNSSTASKLLKYNTGQPLKI